MNYLQEAGLVQWVGENKERNLSMELLKRVQAARPVHENHNQVELKHTGGKKKGKLSMPSHVPEVEADQMKYDEKNFLDEGSFKKVYSGHCLEEPVAICVLSRPSLSLKGSSPENSKLWRTFLKVVSSP